MGSFLFKWAHPATEVFVTGTFDDWGRSEKLEKKDGVFSKLVELPVATEKIYYKFVVDGNWTTDHTAPSETDESGNVNNVLLPHTITKTTSTAATGITGGPTSDLPGSFPETPAPSSENQAFSVMPIPATAGIGNPVSLRAGEKVPDSSTLTSNTIGSTATTSKEAYEKSASGAPLLPNPITPQAEKGAGLFGLPEQSKNMIPESSLPIGTGAATSAEKDPGVMISGGGGAPTTAALAGAVPKEPRLEAETITGGASSLATTSTGGGATTATLAGQVPLEPRGTAADVNSSAFGLGGLGSVPSGFGPGVYRGDKAASTVPDVVQDSQAKAGTAPEASANPEAVMEKSAVEQELSKTVSTEPATSGETSVSDHVTAIAGGVAAGASAAVAAAAAYAYKAKDSVQSGEAQEGAKNAAASAQDSAIKAKDGAAGYASQAQETAAPYAAKAQETAAPYLASAKDTVGGATTAAGAAATSAATSAKSILPESVQKSLPGGIAFGTGNEPAAPQVPTTVKDSLAASNEPAEAAVNPTAVSQKAAVEKELHDSLLPDQGIDEPAGSGVPPMVGSSIAAAHTSPEASTSGTAVADKAAVEKELLTSIPPAQSSGEPAPTVTAATTATAPDAVVVGKSTETPLTSSGTTVGKSTETPLTDSSATGGKTTSGPLSGISSAGLAAAGLGSAGVAAAGAGLYAAGKSAKDTTASGVNTLSSSAGNISSGTGLSSFGTSAKDTATTGYNNVSQTASSGLDNASSSASKLTGAAGLGSFGSSANKTTNSGLNAPASSAATTSATTAKPDISREVSPMTRTEEQTKPMTTTGVATGASAKTSGPGTSTTSTGSVPPGVVGASATKTAGVQNPALAAAQQAAAHPTQVAPGSPASIGTADSATSKSSKRRSFFGRIKDKVTHKRSESTVEEGSSIAFDGPNDSESSSSEDDESDSLDDEDNKERTIWLRMSNVARGRRPSNDNWKRKDIDALIGAKKEIPRLSKSKHIDPFISTVKARVHKRKRQMHFTGGSFEDKRKPGGYRHWFHPGKPKTRRAKSRSDLPKASASRLTLVLTPVAELDDPLNPEFNLNLPDFSGSNLMSSTAANTSPSTFSLPARTGPDPSTENTSPTDEARTQFACSMQRQDAKRALADFIDSLTDDEILRISTLSAARSPTTKPTLDPRSGGLESVPEIVVSKSRTLLSSQTALTKPLLSSEPSALQKVLLRPLTDLVTSGRLLQMAEEAHKVEVRAASWARETQMLASTRLKEMSENVGARSRNISSEGPMPASSDDDEHDQVAPNASSRSLAGSTKKPAVPVRKRPLMVMRSSDGAQDLDVEAPAPLNVVKQEKENGKGMFLQYQAVTSPSEVFFDAKDQDQETALTSGSEAKKERRFGLAGKLMGHKRGSGKQLRLEDPIVDSGVGVVEEDPVVIELSVNADSHLEHIKVKDLKEAKDSLKERGYEQIHWRSHRVDQDQDQNQVNADVVEGKASKWSPESSESSEDAENGFRKLLKRVSSGPKLQQMKAPAGGGKYPNGTVLAPQKVEAIVMRVGSWETDTPSVYSEEA